MKEDKNIYYDGTKLLNMKDLDGKRPEIFIVSSNNSAGKTTFFKKLVFQNFISDNSVCPVLEPRTEFLLINRYNYEIFQEEHKFFDELKELFFPNYNLCCNSYFRGKVTEICIADEDEEGKLTPVCTCGWSIALNDADLIKTCSHMFHNVGVMIFDEFQNSDNKYLKNEIDNFIKIHKAVARGHGKQSRYVPVFMMSNFCTLLNPYYVTLGISDRLKKETRFLRGHGWVLEQTINKHSAKAIAESAFSRAFSSSKEMQMGSDLVYVFDEYTFCQKPTGKSEYWCTVKINGVDYGLRNFDNGLVFCTETADPSAPVKFAAGVNDHTNGYRLLTPASYLIIQLRQYFQAGLFRFETLACRNAMIMLLRY